MNRNVRWLLTTQFLSAFADNAVLFATIALVLQQSALPGWYVPALQGAFLVAFVVLAPWAGRAADQRAKPGVMALSNGVKAMGTVLLLVRVEPLLAYAVVGLGAAFYSPAKYGVVPELADREELVKANGWVESSTIVAIVTGALGGATLADRSVPWAFAMVLCCYLASAVAAVCVRAPVLRGGRRASALVRFASMGKTLLRTPRSRFATLGVSLFWGAAAALRVMLVAWAPLVLGLTGSAEIAELILFTAAGIALGAWLAPRCIPLERLRRTRLAAYTMGASILLLATVDGLWAARGLLLVTGISGGLFVVPVNAALQELGHRRNAAGGAVAMQHCFENLAMLGATGAYAYAAGAGVHPGHALAALGALVLVATLLVTWRLPAGREEAVAEAASSSVVVPES